MNGNYLAEGMPHEEEKWVTPPPERKEEAAEIGIIRELSPKKVLEQVRQNLKGYFFDYEKDKYVRIEGMEAIMNEKGISKYLSILSSVITDLVTFSNYKDEEINNLTLYVCDKAIPVIHINYKEYGIKSKSDLDILDIQIFNLTLAAFKKAVGAGDRGVVRGTITEDISKRSAYGFGQQQDRTFLQKINPFGTK